MRDVAVGVMNMQSTRTLTFGTKAFDEGTMMVTSHVYQRVKQSSERNFPAFVGVPPDQLVKMPWVGRDGRGPHSSESKY